MAIGHCDRRPLDRFAAAVGIGNVTGPYTQKQAKPNWREHYSWQVYGSRAEQVFGKLRPFLSDPKIEQYERVRKEANDGDGNLSGDG